MSGAGADPLIGPGADKRRLCADNDQRGADKMSTPALSKDQRGADEIVNPGAVKCQRGANKRSAQR